MLDISGIATKIDIANQEIQKVYKVVGEYEDMFDHMNLKLHDAFYYSFSKLEEDFPSLTTDSLDLFYAFAEESYNVFLEDLRYEHGIDFHKEIVQLNRTSSFYLIDPQTRWGVQNFGVVGELMVHYFGYPAMVDQILDSEYKFISKEFYSNWGIEELEDLEVELDFIGEGLVQWYEERVANVKTMYQLIRRFKDNQVAFFQEFLEYYEEYALEDEIHDLKRQIESTEEKYQVYAKMRKIRTRYDIGASDYQELKKLARELEQWEKSNI